MGEIMGLVRNGVRIRLLAAVAISAMAIASPASAQEGQRQEYNVEAGDLGAALRTVSRLSGREIIFGAEAVKGKHAPRLRGTYSADEAVRALLEGSDLTAEFRKDVILIRGRSEASGEVADRPAGDNDIIVTGSHIRGGEATSPMVVASREKIRDEGLTDLGSYARTLTQNFSGGQNPGVVGGGGQGGSENTNSSSALNLRGLGPDATLTLINGHRAAYDGIFQGIDLSAIPLAAIDRIEVVADGASALYGSDAVGGVANILLRRDFQGAVTSARLGAATDGGDFEQQYNVVAGTKWRDGGIMAAVDYKRATAITARQRSYTQGQDGDATLLPRQEQISAVVSGHHQLSAGVQLEWDGYFNSRDAVMCNAFQATSNCTTNGARIDTSVRSYSITPTLRFELPRNWELSLSGTYGGSKTEIYSPTYNQGKISATTRPNYNNTFATIEAGANGSLFRMPGGEARLALGGGYRSVKLDVNSIRTNSNGVSSPVYLFNAHRDIYFGYSEISLPLVGADNRFPLFEQLLLTGAARYENYRGVGDVLTPKFGLIYKPTPDVTIKGSWGKSFKAATLFQAGQAREAFLAPAFIFSPGSPGGLPVILIDGGNSALKPERATTWTASVGYAPAFAEGLRIEASYFHILYKDRVAAPISSIVTALDPMYADLYILNPTLDQVNSTLASLNTGLTNQSGGPFNPSAIGAIVDNSLQNISHLTAQGIDLAVNYRKQLGPRDQLQLNVAGSYLESEQQLADGMPVVQRAGVIYNPPHWRGRASATWQRDNFSLTGVASYIGGTLDNRLLPFARVGSFTTLDAVARIRASEEHGILGGIDVTLAIQNILNEKPDTIRTTNPASFPFDSTNYSSVGRTISITISKTW